MPMTLLSTSVLRKRAKKSKKDQGLFDLAAEEGE